MTCFWNARASRTSMEGSGMRFSRMDNPQIAGPLNKATAWGHHGLFLGSKVNTKTVKINTGMATGNDA
eukprot:scaffold5407_cov132-Cylindrotheca_fusiformis.AAC.6